MLLRLRDHGARSHTPLACTAVRSWPGKTINERGEVTYLAEPVAGPIYKENSAAPYKENRHPSIMRKEPPAKHVADPLSISHETPFNPNEVKTPDISCG